MFAFGGVEGYFSIFLLKMTLSKCVKFANTLGPVVQSIVSLTTLLRHSVVKYMPTTLAITLLFLLEKIESLIFFQSKITVYLYY